MLHEVPNSRLRRRLLRVVVMQHRLLEALCALPAGSVVTEAWLQAVWPRVPGAWIGRFWVNDKGNRAGWIGTIAGASVDEKNAIRDMMSEQLRFLELYDAPPTVRLTMHDWGQPTFDAVNKLLKSFYAPLFYADEGFPDAGGTLFHKDHLIAGFSPRVKICPYTDNVIQDTKLDHFLPKDKFPMLSCHPDNLIPCSTDSNSGSHKGTEVPLDANAIDQAGAWFHPRRRPAIKKYRLSFTSGPTPQPRVNFVAHNAEDQPRLDNMARMFGLYEFWGGILDDEVQSVASDVWGLLQADGKPATEANVKDFVLRRARQEQGRIGRDGLAIAKSFFYEHIAQTPNLLAQVIRTCTRGA